MRNRLFSVMVAALAAGCGSSGGGTGGTGGSAGMPPPSLKTGNATTNKDADYSCNGHFTDPAGATAAFPVQGQVVDFQSKNPVPMATISVYADLNSLLAGTASDTKMTDSMGKFTGLMIPAGHFRVNFKTTAQDQIDTYEVYIPVDPTVDYAMHPMDRNSVSHFTATALPGLVGIDYDMTKAVVAGGVRDCTGTFARGALISINAGGADVPDTQVFYFSDQDLPVRKSLQQYTNYDGLFTGVNIPPSGMATVTANGVLPGTTAVVKIGQMQVPLFGGALTISDIPPLAQ